MNTRAADAARLKQLLGLQPRNAIAWHNLAAAEGDLGHMAESEAAARRAIALGVAAPETRLVLGRALQLQRKLDEAESAFKKAIALRPEYVDAHRDLAQLLWMRSGRADYALRKLDQALRDAPEAAGLHLVKATVLEFAGDHAAALAAARTGLANTPDDVALLLRGSHLCAQSNEREDALMLAERAARLMPGNPDVQLNLCQALLAAGRHVEAEAQAGHVCAAQPLNQYAIALRATAWRLLGDARYAALYDYQSLVDKQILDTPQGWSTLDGFLREVASELAALHAFRTHPLGQSVRGGSQLTIQAAELARPLIKSLFDSIGASLQRFITKLGSGDDPVRARSTGRGAISGAWSVRLDSGGHHADHVHPQGWLSSACYIALPPSVGAGAAAQDRAGWLRLGQPAFKTEPPLAAEHFVKPEAGLLVLFPAYMWHGVEPFESDQPRLSVAFDVVPA